MNTEADSLESLCAEMEAEFDIPVPQFMNLHHELVSELSQLGIEINHARLSYVLNAGILKKRITSIADACVGGESGNRTLIDRLSSALGARGAESILRQASPYIQDVELLEATLTEAMTVLGGAPIPTCKTAAPS